MIKGNKNIPLKLVETFSNKFFSKSIFGFQFWTKKMSKNENLRKVLKNGFKLEACDHNALKI
jgi:hypothetical protein